MDNTIFRTVKDENFTVIRREWANDTRLSFEARGVLAYILTKPDNWAVYPSNLIKQSKAGKQRVYRILKELEMAGYLVRSKDRDEHGRVTQSVTLIYETPLHTNPFTVEQYKRKRKDANQDVALQDTEKQDIDKQDVANRDTTKYRSTMSSNSTDKLPESIVQSQPVQPPSSVQPNPTYLSSHASSDELIDSEAIHNPSCTESVQTSQTESLTILVQRNQTPLKTKHVKAAAPQKKPRRAASTNPLGRAVMAQNAPNAADGCNDMGELAQTLAEKKPKKVTRSSAMTQEQNEFWRRLMDVMQSAVAWKEKPTAYSCEVSAAQDFAERDTTIENIVNHYLYVKNTQEWAKTSFVSLKFLLKHHQSWLQAGKPKGKQKWTDPIQPKPATPQPTSTYYDHTTAMYTENTQTIDAAMTGEITF